MFKKSLLAITCCCLAVLSFAQPVQKLWYKQPARQWTEALPVGNGRLGAMVFGRVGEELIQLNEGSLWTGGPVRTNVNPGAYEVLQQIREALLKEENYEKAYQLCKKMQGYYSESFLPLGDLTIRQRFADSTPATYYRDLNINDAIATTKFTTGGVTYTRQVISSAPDNVIAIHFTASKPGALNFTVGAFCPIPHTKAVAGSNELVIQGKAASHIDPNYVRTAPNPITQDDPAGCRGMRFNWRMKAVTATGTVRADTSGITVSHATEVVVYVVAATSFNGFDKCPDSQGKDEKALAMQQMKAAAAKKWAALLSRHTADFHTYFNRLSFTLATPADNSNAALPMNERLMGYAEGAKDPSLETLYFQYGRYLLISCSRPGGRAANLQGIWNKEMRPPWSSNYTTNINVQMNYWPAEVANLSEMHEPMLDYIKDASVTGAVTAREFYHAGGWAMHHNSDIWGLSNPVGDIGRGDPKWANWTMGSPWLAQHLWTHYAFTKDKQWLKTKAYPIMKGAALFCLDWLVTDKNGLLVTAPGLSPENGFYDDNGKQGSVSIATTMDMSIIRDLFNNMIDACNELNEDLSFRDTLLAKRAKLFPLQIGRKGNIQEWYKDWEDPEPHHRHVSHLFGLYPGREISPVATPQFAAAARKTLELRGDDGTGWSLAWKINFWSRLLDGNHAYTMVRMLLHLTGQEGTNYAKGGGSYANLFDAHPPFQIDGNFGGIAGMSEMLLQSHLNEIHLLAALPDAWATGSVKGFKARGNFTVNMDWKDKQLTRATIQSLAGSECSIRTAVPVQVAGVAVKPVADNNGYIIRFKTTKGSTYIVTPVK